MGQFDSGDDWVTRSRKACPDDLMRAIVEDNRGGPPTYSSPIPPAKRQQQSEEPQKPYTYGWVDAAPLSRPAGIEHVDALCDMQDKLDAAQRARQMGLSPEEWAKLSEKDIKDRKEQQEKKLKGPKA
jgi:hypothetical protein